MKLPSEQIAPSSSPRRRRPKDREAQDSGRYRLKAISRALDVLDCLAVHGPELSLKELSVRIRMPESSLFRILLTLSDRGYLEQASDGTYRLAPHFEHAYLFRLGEVLKRTARPHLVDLSTRMDETCSVAMLFVDEIRALDAVETFQEIRMVNRPGRILPPNCSSLGKAITAFQPPEMADRILETYGLYRRTPNTLVDRRALLDEFEQVRRLGYAVDREESAMGGVCLGVPVRVGDGVRAALSISGPVFRMSPEKEQEIIAHLKEHARRLEAELSNLTVTG